MDYWTASRVEGGKRVERVVDLSTIPLYVRAGAILPIGPIRQQYTGEVSKEAVTLHIYPGADGRSTWHDDDGISYAHERGEFMWAACAWNDAARTHTIRRDAAARIPLPRTVRIELAGSNKSRLIEVDTDGATVKF